MQSVTFHYNALRFTITRHISLQRIISVKRLTHLSDGGGRGSKRVGCSHAIPGESELAGVALLEHVASEGDGKGAHILCVVVCYSGEKLGGFL